MRQSLISYSAVVCIAAGGLLMGGAGTVAFADPTVDSGGTGAVDNGTAQTAEPSAAPRGFRLPNWMRLPSFGSTADNAPRIGFIPPPLMNLPSTMRQGATSNGSSTTRQGTEPPGMSAFDINTATAPAGRDNTVEAALPDTPPASGSTSSRQAADAATQTPASTTRKPPTVDLTTLVPQGVPTGTPLTIENPLRQLLASDLDMTKPIAEQLPPLALLAAVSEQIPLAELLIAPAMQFADVVIPMLLSDVVVPTLPLSSMLPTPLPKTEVVAGKPETAALAHNESPPVDLSLTGMDVAAGPAPVDPAPLSLGIEKPQAPPEPSVTDPDVAPLSDPVEFRAGYSDYLRNAGMAQITAIAVPGAAAILLFSLGGGFIGYRQARAGHVIRAEGITRFLR
ncbi:MAG: hypothetical protein ACM4D3_11585 [Candidatus Sericytochromatia bacterium]